MKQKTIKTQKLVLLALLTAIVIVLQSLAAILPVYPFTLALSLVPIVIGAALIGTLAGVWLGSVFAFVILVSSPDVAAFMSFSPPATIILILLRGILSGLTAGAVYKVLKNRNRFIAVFAAAFICPVVNTGVLVLGIYIFFLPLLEIWEIDAASVTSFIFLTMVGINFILELGVNLVLSPTILRLIHYRQKISIT